MSVTEIQKPLAVHSAWYTQAMEHLVTVIQQLSEARDVNAITEIVRTAARELTGADGATFILRDGNQCYYAEENAIEPLWKGLRFPLEICVSGWVMLNSKPALIPDIYQDPRVPTEAYKPTFVKSMAMVPIRGEAPIGAIGNYWATVHTPTLEQVTILQALADTTSVALENAALYERLQGQVATLEQQQSRILSQHDALEVFTRALAHDLKEPVRTLHSFSNLINEDGELPEKARRHARFIESASERMGLLIDTVFQYTQLDDPELQERQSCSLSKVMRAVELNLAQLIYERGALISSGALPELPANEGMMLQLLQNLVSNAVRHNAPKVAIHVDATERSGDWLFKVRDTGQGIASGELERIFQPFKRLQAERDCTGLGLAICRKVVSIHGGQIWCESTPGDGTTFFFTLPKSVPQEVPEPTIAETAIAAIYEANKHKGKPLSILLVDDMDADIEMARILFDKAELNYDFHVAHGGAEAYDMLKRKFKGGEVDMMLVDINMPGMNGFELLEKLKADNETKEIPVVMCTGSTYERDRTKARMLGAAGYITKPTSIPAIQAMLAEIPVMRLMDEIPKKASA